MSNTFLIHAPHNQSVKTEEGYEGRPIVYSNPAYYESKEILAADFGSVDIGDNLIICFNSSFKYIAKVSSIEMLTDTSGGKHNGLPVKVVFGTKECDFPKISASVACNRLSNKGVEIPRLLNPITRGFKQRAFAERLERKQTEVINKWIKKVNK